MELKVEMLEGVSFEDEERNLKKQCNFRLALVCLIEK